MAITWIEVTPTVAAAAYAAGDHVGTVMEFANAVGASGGSGVVIEAHAIFTNPVAAQIDLTLFSATPGSPGADNVASTWTDATSQQNYGSIMLPTSTANALNAWSNLSTYKAFKCAVTSLFVVAITRNVWTPESNGVMFRLGIIPAP